MADFYIWYTPSEGESKNENEISGMYTYFCVVMETWFDGHVGYAPFIDFIPNVTIIRN